jgi:hypothetical protein
MAEILNCNAISLCIGDRDKVLRSLPPELETSMEPTFLQRSKCHRNKSLLHFEFSSTATKPLPRLPFSALPYSFIQQYTLSSLDTNFANSILIDTSWLHSSRSRSTLSSLSRSNPFSTTARSSDPDLRIARLFTLSSSPAKPGTYPRQLIVA